MLTAIARDVATNETTSTAVNVTVDNEPPDVSVTAPAGGTSVGGTSVKLRAAATDSSGIAGVQFLVDDTPLGAEDTSAPYEVAWDTTGESNGAHTVKAVARDTVGNTKTSTAVNLLVDNVAPSVAVTAPMRNSM